MAEEFPDLSEAIRTALVGDPDIAALLPAYAGSLPVFTRRPVPADAPYPMLVVSADLVSSNEDGVYDQRPILVRDVAAYHSNPWDGAWWTFRQGDHWKQATSPTRSRGVW
jgi:hypothetical protein